jgi:hypothetical protein
MPGADRQTAAMFSYLSPEAFVPPNHPRRAIRLLANAARDRLSSDFAKSGCRRKLAALYRRTQRKHVRDVAGIGRIQRHVSDLLGYLGRNQDTLVHYAARRRRGEPISTAFVESAVNEIIAKRMNKKQQMRRNKTTVQSFLDVRTAVLNDNLEDAFRHRYPGFRPANDDHVLSEAA